MTRYQPPTSGRITQFIRYSCIFAGALFFALSGAAAYAEETDNTEVEEEEERITPGDFISKFWELDQSDKRGTFVIRTFQPNFFLPAHYSSSINRQPTSPSRGDAPEQPDYDSTEIKLQISLRTKLWENLFLPNADLWAAYTQTSLWQAYDNKDSRPFRSTDHNPEIIYTVPIAERLDVLPGKPRLRMVQAGFAHHSNGQSCFTLSRSWELHLCG